MEVVVVGIDLPPTLVEPVYWAYDYCRIVGGQLVEAVADRRTQAECDPGWYEQHLAEVHKMVEADTNEVLRGASHRLEIRDGDPGDVVADVASDEGATLVVVGAGSGGFHSFGLGSVAHHLARRLVTPLVIVPGLGGPLRRSPVVVGLDGSPGDVSTLAWAVRFAAAVDGSITVVYASDPMASSYGHPKGQTRADQKEAVVREQLDAIATGEVPVAMTVEVDHPVSALTRVADDVDASLVVVGRKGAGGLRGVLLGKVPAHLPFHACRPVAIIPRHTAR